LDGLLVAGLLRHDHVVRAGVSASWPLVAARAGVPELDVLTSYDFTRHRSTTAGYNYRSHAVGVGVRLEY
jgi:hypothetical protein